MTTENLKIFYDEIMMDELDFVSGSNAAQEDFNKTFRSEDKNYKAHEDAIKKIPPTTIIPIPMIPITQPISPPKICSEDKNYKAHEDAIKKIPPTTIIPIPMIPITQPISPPKI